MNLSSFVAKSLRPILISSGLLLMLMTLSGFSCAQRVILVQPGTAVQTAEPMTGKVLAPDKNGSPVLSKGVIPAGATVVMPLKELKPLPQEEKK